MQEVFLQKGQGNLVRRLCALSVGGCLFVQDETRVDPVEVVLHPAKLLRNKVYLMTESSPSLGVVVVCGQRPSNKEEGDRPCKATQ
jgi:hypothetical protein